MKTIVIFSFFLAAYSQFPVACSNPSVQAQDMSNANAQLTGSWGYFGDKSQPGVYIFNRDGSFMHYTAVRNNYLRTGSLYAMEALYKGNYQTKGKTIFFSNVSISRFDRTKDNANRNRIGDIAHAKKMLNTTTGFTPWTLEAVEFNFIESGVVRIAKKDDKDEARTVYRADWDKDAASPAGKIIDRRLTGSWQASTAEIYVFYDDGRFNHFSTSSRTEGRFTASEGKIYFTNIIYEKGETWEEKYPDAVYEYEMGKDGDGDYLNIANFLYGVTHVDISTAYTFRKSKQKNDKSEAATDKSTNSFQLKIYHGFDFPNKRVVKYDSRPELTDLRFYQQTRRTGVFAYLGAAKIREFDNPPTGLLAAQVNGWNDYSFSPKTGAYYVIRSRDGRHYLLYLKKFDNQAKAAGYWQLELEWKEISI